ncbi:hypothetical protein CPB84DRAFT_1787233 [Gymnopilus junonius]|uniref:Microsomal glutathione S-transferase 3 n=1 Tax=Gymnopilus junonius TaxID=109634 RepID=A0A9P5NGI2_GYMJU|nr:hypothetical protein CPB84DRAFT_1787233 [Gymnopilus junonius]
MSTTVTIPEGFQYVGAALLSTTILLFTQNSLVSRHRKKAGIEYPQMYAEKAQADSSREAYQFNCAQRAHQNTLENIPILFTTSLLSGLQFPIPTAIATALWTVSRFSYTFGYIKDPKKRGTLMYILGQIGQLGMIVGSLYVAGNWLLAGFRK